MNLDRRLLREARAVRFSIGLTIGAGLLAGIATVAQARYLSLVVAEVFLGGKTLAEVGGPLGVLLAVVVARAALTGAREVLAFRAAGRVKRWLRERLFARLLDLGPAYARAERTGELANTLTEGVEALDAYFAQYLPNLALAALVPLAVLAFVFPLDLVSGLVFLVTAPLIPVFMVLIGKLAERLTKRQWQLLSRLSAHFLDVLQGLPTLKLLGRSKAQAEVIARVSRQFGETTLGVLRVAFLSALALELLATVSTAIVAVEVGLRLLYGAISFEQAFFVLVLAPEFYLPLRTLGASFHAGISGVTAAQRVFEVLETPDRTPPAPFPAGEGAMTMTPPSQDGKGNAGSGLSIRFERVSYAYADGERSALRDVSFEVAPGERVALVGPSGSGKSTVAHLLLRFAEPDRGDILVGGRPLREMPADEWRARVAWVPQHPYLFHGSVADNIRLGRPEAGDDEVVAAAQLAHADEFIRALPAGYATPIGERGVRLSGGQAQRLALARAFLRARTARDAPLLVLDEPTANLDPEQEALIEEAVERLMAGRTVLTIAHRLSTVRRADRIVVLEQGRVVEVGRHDDLLAASGLYRRMVGAYAPAEGQAGDGAPALPRDACHAASHEGAACRAPTHDAPVGDGTGAEPADGATPLATGLESADRDAHGTFWRLLMLAWPVRGWMLVAALLGTLTVASGVGLIATAAYIIAAAALHPSVADLAVAIVGVRFFGISRGVFRYLERYVSHAVTFRLLARLRVWLYEALEPLAPARLLQHRSGDLLARVVSDVETLQHFYVRVVAPPAVAALAASLAWLFLRAHYPSLAWVLLAFLLLAGVGAPLLTQRLGRGPSQRLVSARAALGASVVDGAQGLADLLAFGQGARQLARVRAANEEVLRAQGRLAWIGGLGAGLGSLLANVGMWAVLVVAVPLVSAGRLEGVHLPVLALGALASFEAVLPLPLAFQHLGSCLEAGRRLFALVDAAPAVREPAAPSPRPRDHGLVVRDLTFAYQPGGPLALAGVSFAVPPGRTVAIVGPSGSGKSTLVNLLLRFWEYDAGEIRLGGHELRDYRQEDLRRLVAVVTQRTHLFNATIRDNLLVARPTAADADLIRVAGQAQLHDFVASLPEGYDTWIGEQGLRLSGGERQRLAVARALLREAPILILDEATASLDSITEQAVLGALRKLAAGRTVLMVTHRLVGLEGADEILVLDGGRVVQRGRHRELLAADGPYRRMWLLQRQVALDAEE